MNANVVLLGGSNSVIVNGLQSGLKEGVEAKKMQFYNLAVGATSSIQNFYELKRKKIEIYLIMLI
ncbi:hypothetical protein OLT89_04770 [Campylobacter jejuni]|nr:hypothetical protein [Campylobacter jejuni]